jgi:hypothetical protein
MKDYLGRELNVGDLVVFAGSKYTAICLAHIIKFGKKQVILDVCYSWKDTIIPIDSPNKPTWAKAICRYPQECLKVEVSND